MMVPDHASRALGALPALHSWPQSTAELHVRGALNRLDPPCLTSVGPKHGEQTTSAYARRNETAYEAAAMDEDGSKRRAIANHFNGN